MTDNRTTELREKLTERGIEYTTNDHMGVCETSWNGFTAMQLTPGAKLMMAFTPEQAIAATLGNHEIVRCRDCVHYYEADEYHPQGNYDKRCCKYFDTYDDEVEPDGFCAWSCRRSDKE